MRLRGALAAGMGVALLALGGARPWVTDGRAWFAASVCLAGVGIALLVLLTGGE